MSDTILKFGIINCTLKQDLRWSHYIKTVCSISCKLFFFMKLYVQWIHKIAKANDIMYPDYRDTKLFLNILISLDDTTENGKVFQTATACEKKEK